MPVRIVENGFQREQAIKFILNQPLPLTLTIAKGKKRSTEQNRLQRLWTKEIAEQMEDRTPEEVRGYNKLHHGVPIMRLENDEFREKYDTIVRPLPYEQKLLLMQVPLDMPVTRLMSVKQKTDYLNAILQFWSEQGVVLTMPDGDLLGLESPEEQGKE